MIVREYTIQLTIYHDEIVGRILFARDDGRIEESSLYSLAEITNIVALWRDDQLQGSFAIGTQLAATAVCHLRQYERNEVKS